VNEETDQGPELVKESLSEHETVKNLIQELRSMAREHSVILTEDTFTTSRPLKSARLSSKSTMLTGYQGSNHPGKSMV
jgi:hypothetical protein